MGEKSILTGQRVGWEYVAGKGLYGLGDKEPQGFGILVAPPRIGERCVIVGNLGIVTSTVEDIKNTDTGDLVVTTRNSTYLIIFLNV